MLALAVHPPINPWHIYNTLPNKPYGGMLALAVHPPINLWHISNKLPNKP